MKIEATPLPGVLVVKLDSRIDQRGSIMRVFCENELGEVLGERRIVQSNHSRTAKVGTVRGMHFQYPPYAEMKLITCLHGSIRDVAVDLRAGSPTFLQWFAIELNGDNQHLFIIPEGCAHGFQVLQPESELLYFHTAPYTQEAEGGVRPDDPKLNIVWTLPISEVSPRDQMHQLIDREFTGVIA